MNEKLVEDLAKQIIGTYKELVKTETVVGKEFKVGEYSVVPVMKVSIGFGAGGSMQKGTKELESGIGGGAGGGLKIEPVAFLVSYGNEVNLLNLGKGVGLEAVFECMPDVIGKTADTLKDLVKKATDKQEKNSDKTPEAE